MARFWVHCHHLYVDGQKMSKSKGTVYYTDTLLRRGFDPAEIRFFLIYGHYRTPLDYSSGAMAAAAEKLRGFRERVGALEARAEGSRKSEPEATARVRRSVEERLGDDLDVKGAFDALDRLLSRLQRESPGPDTASGILKGLRDVDEVLGVIF